MEVEAVQFTIKQAPADELNLKCECSGTRLEELLGFVKVEW